MSYCFPVGYSSTLEKGSTLTFVVLPIPGDHSNLVSAEYTLRLAHHPTSPARMACYLKAFGPWKAIPMARTVTDVYTNKTCEENGRNATEMRRPNVLFCVIITSYDVM